MTLSSSIPAQVPASVPANHRSTLWRRSALIVGAILAGLSLWSGDVVADDQGPGPRQWGCDANLVAVRHKTARQVVTQPRNPSIGCVADTGAHDMTPMLQVTRNGTLFVARSSQGVLRSQDGGRTWTTIDVPANANGDDHTQGIHGFVHVDATNDRVYYTTSLGAASCGAFTNMLLSKGTVVSWSDDLGATWKGSTVGCDTYDWGKLVTAPAPPHWGHFGKGGHRSIVYFLGVGEQLVGNKRFVYRSFDGGATWERTRNYASAVPEPGLAAVAPDGTLYFDVPASLFIRRAQTLSDPLYPWNPADECKLFISVSEDQGDTWRQSPVPDSLACNGVNGQQRVAVDILGNVYAVWTDDRDQQLYLAVSRNKGRSWSPKKNIASPAANYTDIFANVVAREPGHIAVSYLGSPIPTHSGIFPLPSDRSGFIAESFDALAPNPTFDSVPMTLPNNPMMRGREDHTEGQAYVTFDRIGTPWAVFVEHSTTAYSKDGAVVVGSIKRAGRDFCRQ